MARQQPPAPPPEALPDSESNRYLVRVKTSLCKRWSVSRMETLYEIADLAIYLWAPGRVREAVAVAASVAVAVPAPPPLPRRGGNDNPAPSLRGQVNYNLWCPATFSHALVTHLGAEAMPEQVAASRAALLADAGIARNNPGYLVCKVAEARQRLEAASDPKAMKWECIGLARSVGTLVLYAELAAAGDPVFAPHAADAATLVPQLLAKLGSRIQGK